MSGPILQRVASGDQQAVAEALDRYGNLVWSLARRFIQDRTEAEDAVQEIFIELWSNAHRYDPAKAKETTFVAMLARRRLIDRLRKKGREPVTEEFDVASAAGQADGAHELETRVQAAQARKLIGTLRPEQQQIIHLAVYGGHTHRSIADKLGLPLGTVKTHLRRGLMRVREEMQAAMAAGEEAST